MNLARWDDGRAQALQSETRGSEGILECIRHDHSTFVFIPSGDRIAVEGVSVGRMSGISWSGGTTPGGRFCNVFEFREVRIAWLQVYLDPDYLGEDESRFRWGRAGRQW